MPNPPAPQLALLPGGGSVPIVGLPFTLRNWWPAATVNCGCESKHALFLNGIGNATTCPDCQKSFAILALKIIGDQIGLEVGQVTIRPRTDAPGPR